MTIGEKLARLRTLEGFARGLERELTQAEVARGVREELDGQISQSYLSQLESGARPHMTANTRLLLARFFKVHPGHLVDDLDGHHSMKPRRALDDRVDLWLIDGAETFAEDRMLADALLKIAKHDKSRDCLVLLGSIVENRQLIERLVDTLEVHPRPARKKRRA